VPPAPPRAPADWRGLHLWQIQPVRDLLVFALALGLIHLGYRLSLITVPMLLALLLAYLFEPVVLLLTRLRFISRQGAALVIILAAGAFIVVPLVLGVGFAVVQGSQFAAEVAANISRVEASVAKPDDKDLLAAVPAGTWMGIRDWIHDQTTSAPEGGRSEDVRRLVQLSIEWVQANAQAVSEAVGKRVLGTTSDAVGAALKLLGSVVFVALTAFLTAFFFFFFSTGFGRVTAFWRSLIPERKQGVVIDLARKMDRVIAGFIRGRLTICAIQSVVYSTAYWIIGVPAPLLVGPLVAIAAIVPFGAIVGVPLSMLLLALESHKVGPGHTVLWILLAPFVVYALCQALDDYFLSPFIQGKTTDMDTPSILFATLAGGALAGFYGVLIAIPVAACIKILLRELFWPRFHAWAAGQAPDILPISKQHLAHHDSD
jgi:predicted PurR-regulated permease PerM